MNTLSRADWGAKPARYVTPLDWSGVRYAVLHWPASMGVRIGTDTAAVVRWLRAWQELHQVSRGWSDIAYSHAIDLAGRCWTLRGWDRVEGGAKNLGGRCVSVLAVMGSEDTPTPAMLAAIREWQAEADRRAGRSLTHTWHGALIGTDCPGPALTKWAKAGFPKTTNNKEDDMPEPKDVWQADIIQAPDESVKKGNKYWTPSSYLQATYTHALESRRAAGAALGIVKALAKKQLTAAEVEAAAREGAAQALAGIIDDATVVLTVGDQQ